MLVVKNWVVTIQRPFGNLGIRKCTDIGISIYIGIAKVLFSACEIFLKKWNIYVQYAWIFFVVLIYLCKSPVFKVSIMAISVGIVCRNCHRTHLSASEIACKKSFDLRVRITCWYYLNKPDFVISKYFKHFFNSCFKIAHLIAFI